MTKQLNVRIDDDLVNFIKLEVGELSPTSLNEFTEMLLSIGTLYWILLKREPNDFYYPHNDHFAEVLKKQFSSELQTFAKWATDDTNPNDKPSNYTTDEWQERQEWRKRQLASLNSFGSLYMGTAIQLELANRLATHSKNQDSAHRSRDLVGLHIKNFSKGDRPKFYGPFPYYSKKAQDLIDSLTARWQKDTDNESA